MKIWHIEWTEKSHQTGRVEAECEEDAIKMAQAGLFIKDTVDCEPGNMIGSYKAYEYQRK